ncbi:Putative uncharacterized protein [Staphylococcus xylosus]|nr:hypothetical protein [Staphylococcus xylosus]CEF18828.1 Putative uncharacterized protein [Staphylococcus xylosus]
MTLDNVATMSELKKVSEEIDNRANMSLVYKKYDELKQGVEDLIEQY